MMIHCSIILSKLALQSVVDCNSSSVGIVVRTKKFGLIENEVAFVFRLESGLTETMDMIIHGSLEILGSLRRRKAGSIPSLMNVADYLMSSLIPYRIEALNDCEDGHSGSPHCTVGDGGLVAK